MRQGEFVEMMDVRQTEVERSTEDGSSRRGRSGEEGERDEKGPEEEFF